MENLDLAIKAAMLRGDITNPGIVDKGKSKETWKLITLRNSSGRTLSRIPLAGSVYKTLKQLLETFLRDNSTRFRRVVLVEYPREGLFSVGFVTGVVGPSLQPDLQQPLLSVFIPTAPNPTTGWYTLVPETSVKDLNISVEDAFRTIISAGIVNPDERENSANRSFSSLFAQFRATTATSSASSQS